MAYLAVKAMEMVGKVSCMDGSRGKRSSWLSQLNKDKSLRKNKHRETRN